jgi:hypothetical protein
MPRPVHLAVLAGALVIAGLVAACGGDSPIEPSPVPCSFALTPTSSTVGPDGATAVVTVTTRSDCQWTATPSAAWITIPSAASRTGPGSVSYVVAPNASEASRTGGITIADVTLSIAQEGRAQCTFDISPQQQGFGATGGGGSIHVGTAAWCSWTATTSSDWIVISSGSSGQGDGTVSYTVAANAATQSRAGTIAIAGVDVSVGQAAAEPQPPPPPTDCQYSVAPVELRMHWHHTGGDVSLTTASGCRWTVDSDTPWLNLVTPPAGEGTATLRFSMSTYTEESSRAAALRVRWPTPTAGQNVWVTQEGCTYAVSVTSQNFTAGAGTGTVYVYGTPISTSCAIGCPWTATSQVSWIRITSAMPRAGDDRFTYEVDANPTTSERIGQILVERRIITIRQAGR